MYTKRHILIMLDQYTLQERPARSGRLRSMAPKAKTTARSTAKADHIAVKVQPATKSPILLPEDCGRYELLFGHKLPNMQGSNPILEEQQNLNVIQIWQDEKVIATIGADRMAFGQFVGPLFVSSTRATALLHITAFPTP